MLTFFFFEKKNLWNTRPSYPLGAEHLCSREEVFFLYTLKISLAPTPREGSFRVMFVGKHHTQEEKEPKTCEREGQNATQIT